MRWTSRHGDGRQRACQRAGASAGWAWWLVVIGLTLWTWPGRAARAAGVGLLAGGGKLPRLSLSARSSLGRDGYDVALSWGGGGVYVHGDYLVRVLPMGRNLHLYTGLGVLVLLRDRVDVAMRLPLGLSLRLGRRLETFLELGGLVWLLPELTPDFAPPQTGLGLRIFF